MVIPNSSEHRPVSIAPSDSLSDSEQLLTMSCEEVVDLKAGVESRRTSRMPDDKDCEVRVHYRVAPASLIQGLAALAELKSRSKRLIMKCLAHKGDVLLSTLEGIAEVNDQYTEVVALNGRYGGLSDLLEQLDCQQYLYKNDRVVEGVFFASGALVASFQQRSKGLGTSVGHLMAIGLCWALTFTENPALAGLMRDLSPELDYFRRYVRERSMLVQVYRKIAQDRIDKMEVKG